MGGEADSSLVGRRLGPYRVDQMLGEGAMGEVYRAEHEALSRQVAIKTLKPHVAADRSLMERFFAEARAVNIIRHENIVECTDLVNQPGATSYIVMELLEGTTLAGAIRSAGRLPARRAARIAAQIADAIGAAHGKGIVHRDLKPENVFLIRRAGSSDYVKVLDFGIARLRPDLAGVTATQSGAIIGTPAYMAPEQGRGEKAGPAADQYALGIMLFHMLTGKLPFAAPSLPQMLIAHQQETPARVDLVVEGVPAALADAVARAVEKVPADRFPDMQAFRGAVLAAVGIATDHASVMLPAGGKAAGEIGAPSAFDDTMAPAATRATAWDDQVGQSSLGGSAGEVAHGAAPAAATADREAGAARSRMPLVVGGVIAAVAAVAVAAVFFMVPRGGGEGGEVGPSTAPAPGAGSAQGEREGGAVVPAAVDDRGVLEAERARLIEAGGDPAVVAEVAGEPEPAKPAAAVVEPAKPAVAVVEPAKPAAENPQPARRASPAAAGPPGFLTVDAVPFAIIWVDGKRLGETPLFRAKVPPGQHRLRAVTRSGQSRTISVDIASGRDTRLGKLTFAEPTATKPAPVEAKPGECPKGQTWDTERKACRKPDLTRELVE